jgi:hypothetical protein
MPASLHVDDFLGRHPVPPDSLVAVSAVHRTSFDTQQTVGWTYLEESSRQRNQAQVSPGADGSSQGQQDQHSTDRDARDTIESTDIDFHD